MTVGLLYPGEMGSSLAQLLTAHGVRVVTSVAGRGVRTVSLAKTSGAVVLPSLEAVVRASDIVFSMVSTGAALDVAISYCELASVAPASAIYVDVNSIGPELACSIAEKVSNAGRSVVDGAINGLAKNLASGGTLFLSGARSGEVAAVLGDAMRVRILGREPGQASTMKMLLGGLSKGLCGLFAELAVMAERREMLPEMLEACEMIYPGIMQVIDRMLPTYAKHSGRRAVEMRELEQTIQNAGVEPCVVKAIHELHDRLASISFDAADGANVGTFVGRLARELSPARPASTSV